MSNQKELEIQIQFLEEATDYVNTLEGVFLDIDTTKRIDLEKINAALRATHSIKGGAAMMGFRVLSDLAHRLEDSLKVLKTRKNSLEIDTHLQSLLLSGVDWLRQIVELLLEGNTLEEQWLSTFCYPIFAELHGRLGSPSPEDITDVLLPEDGQDIIPLLFSTEVEEYLQHLETLLPNSSPAALQVEVATMASELGGLGEMLELPAFTQLCESVTHHLETASPDHTLEIAQLALQAWRRSQALVLTNQRQSLPTQIVLGNIATLPKVESPKGEIAEELKAVSFPVVPLERKTEPVTPAENTVRVPSKQLEQINDLFGELIIQRNGLNLQLDRLRKLALSLSQRVQILDRENHELWTAYSQSITPSHPPHICTPRDQEFNQLSQELLETIVQVEEITTDIQLSVDDTEQIARKFNKTSKQLQRKLTQVRMRPFSDLVERFPRALRDLNVEYGKNVQLKIEGGDTLIERSILEPLNEALMHLLRNAFDHGIEDPVTRSTQGKPEPGLIEITAAHHGNCTIITIRDDGRGISLDKIRHRAMAMGFDPSILADASEQELLSIIFEPGFSTSDQVTALSGRGVGMDVVRNNLKLMRGDIKVDTHLGIGTTITLSVPFTLSVTRVLLVESNRMLLAFPTDVVAEVFLLPNEQVTSIDGRDYLIIQDTKLLMTPLGSHFKFNCIRYDSPELETPPAINASSVLIIKNGNQLAAVQVDRCWGEQEVAIRQVEGNIPLPKGFSNCTILGSGRVVALVNINELLYWISTSQFNPRNHQLPSTRLKTVFLAPQDQKPPTPPSRGRKGTILIVDDSINVRRYLALTLEKGGYQVEQAKDGQDAWEKLQSGLKVQAVVCDIEMPRLDGYSLLERVKSDPERKDLPVAMLTSRSSSKHRQLAMQLGAQAYFSKPYNEQELLQTLEEIIFKVAEIGV